MALSTPILYTISAFDATTSHTFTFSVTGGDQVVANRLIIKENDTLTEVYNQQVTTYNFTHTVAANTMTNGKYYVAYIQTYNSNGDVSTLSTGSQFYCYTTPSITLTNLPLSGIIQNSTFIFSFTYTQTENELLYNYKITLYNQNQVAVLTTGIIYISSSEIPPTTFTYEVNGLTDNSSYYIGVEGVTAEGTSVTTQLYPFNVNYYTPSSQQGFIVTNDACNGWIKLSNNVLIIEATSNPDPPIYINSAEVDLRASGYYVRWENGINQTGDFTVKIWGRSFNENTQIFTYQQENSTYSINLKYMKGYQKGSPTLEIYALVDIYTGLLSQPYTIYSNYINIPTTTNRIFFWLRRVNNIYSIIIENLGD